MDHARARLNMVENQLRPSRIEDPRLLDAMREVPRERFLPKHLRGVAYADEDLPLPGGGHLIEPLALARLIQAIYGIPAPKTPRADLVEIFLTGITTKAGGPIKADLNSQLNNADVDPKKFAPSEMLRLNMSTPVTKNPNRLGVLGGDLQGFPNGRRLADDVVDIEIQAVVGAALTGKLVPALAKGDKVDKNNVRFGDKFPYVGLPSNRAVNSN